MSLLKEIWHHFWPSLKLEEKNSQKQEEDLSIAKLLTKNLSEENIVKVIYIK